MGSARQTYTQILARNVRLRMDELGFTRATLSEASGVSISFLSDLFGARANPSLRVLESLAVTLQTTVPELLLDSGAIPDGYERITALIPSEKVPMIRSWAFRPTRRSRLKS